MTPAEMIAGFFHAAYETLAPDHGYKTREASAVDWDSVPANNKALMIATVQTLIDLGVVIPGPLGRAAEVLVRRPATTAVNEWDDSIQAPAPCQPIGCDAGRHLPGCYWSVPAEAEDCSHRDDPGHDHDECLQQVATGAGEES